MLNISTIAAGVAFVTLAATNVVVMLESFPALAQRNDEKPLDRCSPGGWVLVCDSALHHGLQHESEACKCGNNRSPAYALGCAYCACARPRASAFPEDIDRTPLQAEPFVAEGTGNNYFRDFVRACGHSHSLGTSSFGETQEALGLRLATGLVVAVCLVQCALVFKKRKQPRASVESSRHSGDSCAGDPTNQPRKREAPTASCCWHRSSSKPTIPRRCASRF